MLKTYLESLYIEETIASNIVLSDTVCSIYMNPSKEGFADLQPWSRGVISATTGNLYMCKIDEEADAHESVVIHADIVRWLSENVKDIHKGFKMGDGPEHYVKYFVLVDKEGDKNKLLLSESYPENLSDIEKAIDKVYTIASRKNKSIMFAMRRSGH